MSHVFEGREDSTRQRVSPGGRPTSLRRSQPGNAHRINGKRWNPNRGWTVDNPSIYDLAKRAGVSTATVSRALSGSPLVKEATRTRIVQLAAEIGYYPNLMARNLTRQSTQIVGLIVTNIAEEFGALITKGIEDAARNYDLHLMIWSAHRGPSEAQMGLDLFRDLRVDGIVMAETWTHLMEWENVPDLPIAYVNRTSNIPATAWAVIPDDYYNARIAVERLIALGHRAIAYIGGVATWMASRERLRAYREVMAKYDYPIVDEWILEGDWMVNSGQVLGKSLLTQSTKPTAILAANDLMAIGVLDAARELGVGVPRDLSVMGMDNREVCQYTRPRLSTVSIPLYEMGRQAMILLAQDIKDRKNHKELTSRGTMTIHGTLVERESTGICP